MKEESEVCDCRPIDRISNPPKHHIKGKVKGCGRCMKPLPKRFQDKINWRQVIWRAINPFNQRCLDDNCDGRITLDRLETKRNFLIWKCSKCGKEWC